MFNQLEHLRLQKVIHENWSRASNTVPEPPKSPKTPSTVVLINGDSGTGKTSLIQKFMSMSPRTFEGCSDSVEKNTPFYAFRSILRTLLEYQRLVQEEEKGKIKDKSRLNTPKKGRRASLSRSKLISLVNLVVRNGRVEEKILPILNLIMPLTIPETEYTMRLSQERREDLVQTILIELLRELSKENPLILVFDDAHSIDSTSMQLLHAILSSLHDTVSAVICHNDCDASSFRDIKSMPQAVQFTLRNLSTRDMGLLLSIKFNITVGNSELLHYLIQKTNGNPLQIVQLMKHMIKHRVIHINSEEGTCTTLKSLEQVHLQVSEHVRASVMLIFDGFYIDAQQRLRIASACSEECNLNMVLYAYDALCVTQDDQDRSKSVTKFKFPHRRTMSPINRHIYSEQYQESSLGNIKSWIYGLPSCIQVNGFCR